MLFLLLQESRNAPVSLPGAVSVAAGATECARNAPGRCFCCSWNHIMLAQRSQTLFLLLLLEPQKMLLKRSWTLFVLLQEPPNALATLLDAVSAAAGDTERSRITI